MEFANKKTDQMLDLYDLKPLSNKELCRKFKVSRKEKKLRQLDNDAIVDKPDTMSTHAKQRLKEGRQGERIWKRQKNGRILVTVLPKNKKKRAKKMKKMNQLQDEAKKRDVVAKKKEGSINKPNNKREALKARIKEINKKLLPESIKKGNKDVSYIRNSEQKALFRERKSIKIQLQRNKVKKPPKKGRPKCAGKSRYTKNKF